MGLDTTHDCWHGPYSVFMRWRVEIAKAVGIEDLNDWWSESDFPPETMQGIWSKYPDDPIVILLNHSDCDGIIPVEHCSALADRLEQLIPKLDSKDNARLFIKGLRRAADLGEDVEFH